VELLKKTILACLKGYQMTRYIRPPACRFYPTCSKYSSISINKHGLVIGALLTMIRVLKCQPFHPGGVDEVPDKLFTALKSPAFLVRLLDKGALI
jgi:uncharacterized protein